MTSKPRIVVVSVVLGKNELPESACGVFPCFRSAEDAKKAFPGKTMQWMGDYAGELIPENAPPPPNDPIYEGEEEK
jgi:hypothetical protein